VLLYTLPHLGRFVFRSLFSCQGAKFRLSRLNEPQRRWYVGLLSQRAGSPSDRQLTKITGLDEKTIRRGRQELEGELFDVPHERQRREGGGRPRAEKKTLS
jgi:hypothetical protein